MESPLSSYRVLDLTDEKGFFCGKILGELGADVIKIEPPRGDRARNIGPFYHDIPDEKKSLYWFFYNTSKRGITLNIEAVDGQEIFKKLAETADFVIESFDPRFMDKLGLGYPALSEINPRIIVTSITPFGQTGPYKDYNASDLIAQAMGGYMFINGDTDRPPVRVTIPQAYPVASAHAAAATLIAHYYREMSSEGQWIDVSMQEAAARVLFMEPIFWEFDRYLIRRLGPKIRRGKVYQTELWPCKDGQICFRVMGGVYARGIRNLAKWMEEEGMAGVLKDVKDWDNLDMARMSQEETDKWEKAISNFFLKHTMAELHKEEIKRATYLMPCNTPKQIAEDEQLAARDFWVKLPHPELGTTLNYPGAPFKFSETPWRIQRRAPLIGEHNEEIYEKELGLSKAQLATLMEAGII